MQRQVCSADRGIEGLGQLHRFQKEHRHDGPGVGHLGDRRVDLLRRQGAKARSDVPAAILGTAQFPAQLHKEGSWLCGRAIGQRDRPRLHNCGVEEARGLRGGDVGQDGHGARALSAHGDLRVIAAKSSNVVAHPPQRLPLVAQPVVSLEPPACHPAQRPKAVIRGHQHDPFVGEDAALAPGPHARGTLHEGSSMDPHEDGPPALRGSSLWNEDVEEEAVLRVGLGATLASMHARRLRACRSKGGCVELRRRDRLGRRGLKAPRSGRGLRERNPEKVERRSRLNPRQRDPRQRNLRAGGGHR